MAQHDSGFADVAALVDWQLSRDRHSDTEHPEWMCVNCTARHTSHHTTCPTCGSKLRMWQTIT